MTTLPPLPIPAGAVEFSPKECQRIAAYMAEISSLKHELELRQRSMVDVIQTVIERCGGDSSKEWALSADQRFVVQKPGTISLVSGLRY